MNTSKLHEEIRTIAAGISFALQALNDGTVIEFVLVMVMPEKDGFVTLNTITGIQDAEQIRRVGQHLIDMANAKEPQLDPFEDLEIRGNA